MRYILVEIHQGRPRSVTIGALEEMALELLRKGFLQEARVMATLTGPEKKFKQLDSGPRAVPMEDSYLKDGWWVKSEGTE